MISKNALDLITTEEGYDQPWLWPGGDSGVTIGIGYDLGYCTTENFEHCWKDVLSQAKYDKLYAVIGLKGEKAKLACSNLHDCMVDKVVALKVFVDRILPDYVQLTRHTFPSFDSLPEDTQGALVSLVYNRGASVTGERRKEMKMLQVWTAAYASNSSNKQQMLLAMVKEFKSMTRLWPEGSDLYKRRLHEAKLIEDCAYAKT